MREAEFQQVFQQVFPHLRFALAKQLNAMVEAFNKNGASGNVDVTISFKGGRDRGTDWMIHVPPPKDDQ